jgi:hypothetical protein
VPHIVAAFEKMGSKTVPEGGATGRLEDTRDANGELDRVPILEGRPPCRPVIGDGTAPVPPKDK